MKRLWIGAALACAVVTAQEPAPKPAPAAAPEPADRVVRARIQALKSRTEWSERGSYRNGTRALDEKKYDDAVRNFDQVIERKESRADGALYWKAYALNREGKQSEAVAALDQLQRDYPQSAWLNDAKALRLEVQQGSGQAVSPDSQTDDDLKLLAINGLMRSDPDRATPLLEKVLGDAKAPPKVKERALFVLTQNKSPKSREILMRIAKGGGNPDLQVKAIEFLGVSGDNSELADLYRNASSLQVKEAILNGLMVSGDADKLAEIARTEKDPKLRGTAIQRIGVSRGDKAVDLLTSLYASESDQNVKRNILDSLFAHRSAKPLVDLARKEKDPMMKKFIVERLSMMKDKEATDYMMELLK
jgi:tetratricopeptide repeat protein